MAKISTLPRVSPSGLEVNHAKSKDSESLGHSRTVGDEWLLSIQNLPVNTTCVPVTASIPTINPIVGKEIFYELTQVMELQKLSRLMEQEMVNRFNILRELDGVNDGLLHMNSKAKKNEVTNKESKSLEQACIHTDYGTCGNCQTNISSKEGVLQSNTQTSKNKNETPKREVEEKDCDTFLVLRPDLVVPELRDLPTLHDMLAVPTTLTQATRLIFALRKDMLALRNGVLRRALAKAEERIEMCRKQRVDKKERLLRQLSQVFSKAQLAFIRDGGKTEPWTLEDYLKSISLRSLCRHRTFEYVRNTMKFPLPSMYAVRSMAKCGLMPEVTERFKELTEVKDLRLNRHLSSKKRVRAAAGKTDDATECSSRVLDETIKQAARLSGGDVARRVPKRRQTGDDEGPDLRQPSPRRPCWDTSTCPELEVQRNSDDDESGSDLSGPALHATHPTRDRARGRGSSRGRSWNRAPLRTERPKPGTEREDGKRGLRGPAHFTCRAEVGRASEDGHREGDAGCVLISRVSRTRGSAGGLRSASRGWGEVPRPPQTEWEPPPGTSPKKNEVYGMSPKRGRVVRLCVGHCRPLPCRSCART